MGRLDEIVSEQFARWEQRGRGWEVWPYPVAPEPAYSPFAGYRLPTPDPRKDDGRKPGLFASFFDSFEEKLNPKPPPLPPIEDEEPEAEEVRREPVVELHVALPAKLDIKPEAFAAFLEQLAVCREPIAFELFGESDRIAAQFAAHRLDVPILRRQLATYFPDAMFRAEEHTLTSVWEANQGETAIVEFGLEKEFLLPLATSGRTDPFLGLIGAMSELQPEELALFQVLFQPVQHHWAQSAWKAITDGKSQATFSNRPDLTIRAQDKFASSLYAVVVRIATKAEDFDRAWQIARELAFSLRTFTDLKGNALIPLHNEEYSFEAHYDDVPLRQSHRSGMILNTEELTGFVHFPSSAVQSVKLRREVERTKPAPAISNPVLVLGENRHLGKSVTVGLTLEQRFRHCHLAGVTGSGKSTLLFNLIRQDIEQGRGVGVLDPHGDLIDRLLAIIPPERINDVILFDPSDPTHTVGFNLLSAHSEAEKALLASDLVSVFERHSTSWGDQMNSVLRNAVLAFLESSQGGTLLDLRRFLLEPSFRVDFLATVNDMEVFYYWSKAFPQLTGTKSLGPILTRLDTFLSPKPIRHALAMQDGKLDFAQVMDSGKIFLAKLPQGQIGKENSFLLGSLLIGKFQQLAMARQGLPEAQRRPYMLFCDEFHQFMTPSMAEILNGARKYRLGLTLAHQELRQLSADKDVESAVMANAGTRIVFRVGDSDAKQLAEGFSYFEPTDLSNLKIGQAICRIERPDQDFNLNVTPSAFPTETEAQRVRETVTARSREQFATPRSEIEALLRQQLTVAVEPKPERVKPPKPSEPTPPTVTPPAPSIPLTSSEKEPSHSPTPVVTTTSPASTPRDLGRGGVQHKAIQQRLKSGAEELGFRAVIEKEVLNGAGSIDLVLEKGSIRFACEITITTTIDQEVGNAQKCIRAGFDRIAIISTTPERLQKLSAAISNSLGPEAFARVSFYLPDDFLVYLRSLENKPDPATASAIPPEGTFKVKRNLVRLGAQELKAREEEAIRLIAESMKRKASPKREK